MRNSIKIGFTVLIAALAFAAVYLLRSTDERPATPEIATRPRASPAMATPPALEIETPLSNSPARANYSTGFVEAKPSAQLREKLSGAVESQYVTLVRSLRLTDDESAKLLDILADENKRRLDWTKANRRTFISQEESDTFRTESDRFARDLLGDAKFQQYDDYRKHPAERAQIDRLSEQLIRNESPILSQQQDDQLFAVLKEEMNRTPAPKVSAYGVHVDYEAALKKWREDNLKRFQQRAASLLTADQLAVMKEMGR